MRGRISRFVGAGLLAGSLLLCFTPANAGDGGWETEVELDGYTIGVCIRAKLNNLCLPVTVDH